MKRSISIDENRLRQYITAPGTLSLLKDGASDRVKGLRQELVNLKNRGTDGKYTVSNAVLSELKNELGKAEAQLNEAVNRLSLAQRFANSVCDYAERTGRLPRNLRDGGFDRAPYQVRGAR